MFNKSLDSINKKLDKLTHTTKKLEQLSNEVEKRENQFLKDFSFVKKIVDTSPNWMYVYNLKERKNEWNNAAMEKIIGYTTQELIDMGDSILETIIHPEDVEIYNSKQLRNYRLLTDGETIDSEFRIITKNRDTVWGHAKECILSRDSSGEPTHILGTIVDITSLKEQQLRLKLQTLALDSAANAIVITDFNGDIIYANDVFTTNTGYTFEEVMGKNPRILKSGIHPADFYTEMWNTILEGKVWSGDIINKRKDNELITEHTTITPVLNGKINYFIAIKERL